MVVVGVLGLGEAGGEIAAGLRAAGATVHAYDPLPATNPDAASAADAARGADVILSLTTAAEAKAAARSVVDSLVAGQIYADANTSGTALKHELAALVEPTGAAFADIALMAPVPGKGITTPALASGRGAARFAELFGAFGMPVEVGGPQPGQAARRKLLRSVAWKGLALVAVEALEAARAAGEEDWMRAQLQSLVAEADIDRMVEGSTTHAARRVHEMAAVAGQLRELGVEPRMSEAAGGWLKELRDRG